MNPVDSTEDHAVTLLLKRWGDGDRSALDQLLPIVYDELRRLAASQLRRERPTPTLQPTALVHEVFLHLLAQRQLDFHNRSHFFGAAARIIRRILVDRAREKGAVKRGGDAEHVELEDVLAAGMPPEVDLIDLDDAPSRTGDLRSAEGRNRSPPAGLSIPETAEVLDSSPTTIKREWSIARAWLYERLHDAPSGDNQTA